MARKRQSKKSQVVPGYAGSMMGAPSKNVRGSITEKTRLSGNWIAPSVFMGTTGQDGQRYYMDGKRNPLGDTVGGVSSLYNTYKYLPGTVFHYVPSVGVTTPGNVWIAWIDNPEIMSFAEGLVLTSTAWSDFVRTQSNAKCYPLWQSFTYSMPTDSRRKRFDVNNTIDYTNDNLLDRSVQGLFVVAVVTSLLSSTIARPFIHKHIDLEGLTASSFT